MWIDTKKKTPLPEATVTIYVAEGPMEGIHRECALFKGEWFSADDFIAPAKWVSHWRANNKPIFPDDRIAGKTLSEWAEFARRDDCLDRMVPSDLRVLLSHIA